MARDAEVIIPAAHAGNRACLGYIPRILPVLSDHDIRLADSRKPIATSL